MRHIHLEDIIAFIALALCLGGAFALITFTCVALHGQEVCFNQAQTQTN